MIAVVTGIAAGIAVIVLSLWAVPILVSARRHRARSTRMRAFAADIGWRYTEQDRGLLPVRFLGTPFRTGNERIATHVLSGAHRDQSVVCFEYSYRAHKRTNRYTVVTLSLPASGPTLEVGQERLGHRVLGLAGVRDLQLESDEFNAAFRIGTDDERFAYDVLHPRMMEFLLIDERARHLPVRLERGDLLTWTGGPTTADRVTWMADYLCDVLDRVPSHVWTSTPRPGSRAPVSPPSPEP